MADIAPMSGLVKLTCPYCGAEVRQIAKRAL